MPTFFNLLYFYNKENYEALQFINHVHFQSLSAPEVTVILANVSRHLTFVRSSVLYVQKHLNTIKEPLEFVQVYYLLITVSQQLAELCYL